MRNKLPRFRLAAALLVLTALLATFFAAPAPAAPSGAGSRSGTTVAVEADGTRVETTCTSTGVCTSLGLQRPTTTQLSRKATASMEKYTRSTSGSKAAGGWPTGGFRVLQMNLCNSGLATCWEKNLGRSVPEAQQMIKSQTPDVVTVNEICRSDMPALISAMRETHPADTRAWIFQPAIDDRTNGPFKCANSEDFGVGVVGHVPTEYDSGATDWSGRYPIQSPDPNSHEERVYSCLIMIGNYWACTTHLDNSDDATASAQCHYLMDDQLPAMRSAYPPLLPTVVGGDFNLGFDGMQDCEPDGWDRLGDLDVQNVLATDNDLELHENYILTMQYTDHDALLVLSARK